MNETSYDVYVHDGHITEVMRSEHTTVAKIYGVDWESVAEIQIHPETLVAPKKFVLSAPPKPARTPINWNGFISAAFIVGALLAAWFVLKS